MMQVFKIFLLIALVPQAFAENKSMGSRLSSEQSQLAVELVRDPTRMSENFRQAIKNIVPPAQANVPATGGGDDLPSVELLGKVLTPNQPAAVVLRINERSVHLPKNGSTTTIIDGRLVTIRVDEITKRHVKVRLVEMNQFMILQ
ncbi:MAG: hypothetical protein ACU85E_03800 [Gammaproteobacteria bacterium]